MDFLEFVRTKTSGHHELAALEKFRVPSRAMIVAARAASRRRCNKSLNPFRSWGAVMLMRGEPSGRVLGCLL